MNLIRFNEHENRLIQKIKELFSVLVERHELLRANFLIEGETLYYSVVHHIDFEVECYIWEGEQSLHKFIRPFQLTQLPLFRIAFFKQNKGQYYISFDIHHIVCDGISLNLLLREFIMLWQGGELNNLITPYSDYMIQIKITMNSERIKHLRKSWNEYLPSELPVLDLPVDYPRPFVFNPKGALVNRSITGEQLDKMNEFCYNHKITQFMFFIAVYGLLLRLFTDQKNFIIGTPMKGRNSKEAENTFGPLINSIPVYITVDKQDSFEQYIKKIRSSCLKAFKNKEYPLELLIRDINGIRDISRNMIFDTMLEYRGDYLTEYQFDNAHFLPYHMKIRNAKYDLSIFIEKFDDYINIQFEYCLALFSHKSIMNMLDCYINLINNILCYKQGQTDLTQWLESCAMAADSSIYHGDKKNYPNSILILLKYAMNHYADNTAIIDKHKTTTFHLIDSEADKLADWLVERNVKNQVIAIYMNNTTERICVLLAVIKAGGIFLLIDKDTPQIRVNDMLLESGAIGVFTDENIVPISSCTKWDIRQIDYHIRPKKAVWIEKDNNDPFYLVFTSGTTGKPKGIIISIRAISNYINWAKGYYLNKDEMYRMPFFTSAAFDFTFTSIFLPLVSGNCIVLYDYINHPDCVLHLFRDNLVNIVKLTPTHIGLLLDYFKPEELAGSCVKKIIVGGESFKTVLAAKFHKRLGGRADIYNEYGPAEATIGCMIKQYNPREYNGELVPIGAPIDNICIKLLNSEGVPVPKGAIGQICIAGDGLAEGYFCQKELTEQKFVSFNDNTYYLTGDYARHIPDADIIFLGRKDKQVKIYGRRIELGEIEHILEKYDNIYNVHVLMREDADHELEIAAFFQCDNVVDYKYLRDFLSRYLPGYMIPKYFFQVDQIELWANGKLNEDSLWYNLEKKSASLQDMDIQVPETDKEKIVMELFQQILRYNEAGIDSNFYHCGGDSIKAMQLKNELNKMGYDIGIGDIYQHQTIRNIAAKMKESSSDYINRNAFEMDLNHLTEEDIEDINEILSLSIDESRSYER